MSQYADKIKEAWRLELLKLLSSMPTYESGQYFLYQCMVDGDLPPPSSDQVATELAWLEEQGCVMVKKTSGLDTASITQRGIDVCNGFARIPGIAKPRPQS